MNALQTNFYVNQPVLIDAHSDNAGSFKWVDIALITVGLLVSGAAICTGVGAWAGVSGVIGILGAIGTTGTAALTLAGGVALVSNGVVNTAENLKGDFKLPNFLYSPYTIFSNTIPIFDIDFFSAGEKQKNITIISTIGTTEERQEVVSDSSAIILKPIVSGFYIVFRTIAIVILLSILVYIGIRMMIISTAKEKAKYKQMFFDWLIAMCLLCIMHYIMIFIVNLSKQISNLFVSINTENIVAQLPKGTEITYTIKNRTGEVTKEAENEELPNDPQFDSPIWITNLMGYSRLVAEFSDFEDTEISTVIEYTIIYIVLVIYTLIFTVIYLKRVLYMAFLTIIAPLMAMTYPLDKLHDGKAQGFDAWLKEYIFNALLQPVHLLLYTILIGSVMALANQYPIYALVAMGFMIPAEKMLKSMFGFEKASSPAAMGAIGMAGTGMLMSGLSKLMHSGKGKVEGNEDKEKNKIRFKPERTNTLNTYVNGDSTNNQSRPQIGLGEEDNSLSEESGDNGQVNSDGVLERYNAEGYGQNTSGEYYNPYIDEYDPDYDSHNNASYIQDNLEGDVFIGANREAELNKNYLEVTEPTANNHSNQERAKPRIRNRVGNGIMAVGTMRANRLKSSHPLRKLRRGVTYGMGAATLGMIGLAAGIASGDLGKTAQYTGTAAHIGGGVGKGIGNKVASAGKGTIEDFKQGYYGKEYDDKLREKQIKEWQTDPNNIQYLRAREDDYRRILKDIYPEYAKYGCYDIEDFYAAYQLEKAGRSRAQAISAYKLAKRTGDITASPDLENKWRTRLETEFGNVEDVRSVTDAQYSRIEEEFRHEQERIEAEYEQQRRTIESTMANQEEEYKKLEQELEREQARLEREYENQYKKLESSTLDEELEYKDIEEKYKQSGENDKSKYEATYKELYKKMKSATTDKKLKQEQLQQRFKQNQKKLQDKYQEKYKNINARQEEKFEKIKKEKNEQYKRLMEEAEAKRVKIKDISSRFAETALDDVRMFYENKG